ncbi:MAG TPA: cytochrome c-type biogenesis protein CcmH, partial [Erwinia persicina]|nr:cytochrome c-type biogenesis protein CcmH [Erwinia persicina]
MRAYGILLALVLFSAGVQADNIDTYSFATVAQEQQYRQL